MVYDATMFHPMRWITPRYPLVRSLAVFEAGAGSATTARGADTPVRIGTTRRLESRAAKLVLIVIPTAAWSAALVATCVDGLRPLRPVPPFQ